jgi:hypothetical protein
MCHFVYKLFALILVKLVKRQMWDNLHAWKHNLFLIAACFMCPGVKYQSKFECLCSGMEDFISRALPSSHFVILWLVKVVIFKFQREQIQIRLIRNIPTLCLEFCANMSARKKRGSAQVNTSAPFCVQLKFFSYKKRTFQLYRRAIFFCYKCLAYYR